MREGNSKLGAGSRPAGSLLEIWLQVAVDEGVALSAKMMRQFADKIVEEGWNIAPETALRMFADALDQSLDRKPRPTEDEPVVVG